MTEPLHVLIWGTAAQGPCAYYRGGEQFTDELRKYGVETRSITKVELKGPADVSAEEAFKQGLLEVDLSELEWADVVMFRRYYNTALKCTLDDDDLKRSCGYVTQDLDAAAKHEHPMKHQDDITRVVWPAVRDYWTGGIIYDTDDNHWEIKRWNGYFVDVMGEHDLIADMTRNADLLTTSTPKLMEVYGRYNKNRRVIRNAIDPALYTTDGRDAKGRFLKAVDTSKPRMVYYGSTARLRDYAGRYATRNGDDGSGPALYAVNELARKGKLHRVFVGADKGTEDVVGTIFDEQYPYTKGFRAFGKALANTRGDIGIAPLGGDDFDICKSELHWLEYAVTNMPVVAQRFMGGGPYSVIRDGVDGLMARNSREWLDALTRLANSKDLREQIAGAARERVLAEYDYRVRAAEWADAFKWTAEHAGSGRRRIEPVAA